MDDIQRERWLKLLWNASFNPVSAVAGRTPRDLVAVPSSRNLVMDLMREVIPDPSAPVVYVCGPGISKWDKEAAREKGTEPQPRFLESVLKNLKEIGVPNGRIKREFYG